MEKEYKSIDEMLQDQEADLSASMNVLMNGRLKANPNVVRYNKEIEPELHDVMDPTKRPDKLVNTDPNDPNYGSTRIMNVEQDSAPSGYRIERVNRIALAWQKLIVKRAVGITFGNKVKYNAQPETDEEKALLHAVIRVLKDNKEATLNRKVARDVYGLTEVAECWYVTEGKEPHTTYSKTGTKFKIRVVVFSPKNGDVLYPYFDNNRDMTAFSRRYTSKNVEGKESTYFETYTADFIYKWTCQEGQNGKEGSKWEIVEGYPKKNQFGKIPVIYGCQDEPDYQDVQPLIKRMEKLVSNFGDTNDYHSSPKIAVKGHVNSFCKKGEAGAVLELDPDASVEYLTWNQATQAVKDEYEMLKELIHTISQTPDISWDSVKSLNNVSGTALRLMFMDAVLKAKDKDEIWIDYLTRRVNLIKAILAKIDVNMFSAAASSLLIDPETCPFIIEDETEKLNQSLNASGNKTISSRRTAIARLGWTDDPDKELEDIESEEMEGEMFEQNEPTLI